MTRSDDTEPSTRGGVDVGRALGIMIDAFVVTPLETGIQAVRDPVATAGRVRQELRNARAIGSMVTGGGMSAFAPARNVRESAAERSSPTGGVTDPSASTEPVTPTSDTPPVARKRAQSSKRATPAPGPDDEVAAPGADTLAVPDYDQLPAIDIVDQLADLTAAERDAVEQYELAHRRRRTVLGKIDQLRSA